MKPMAAAIFNIWTNVQTTCAPGQDPARDKCGINSIQILIANFIRIGLYVAGLLAIIFIIIGGLQYITSAGNPQSAAKAKRTLVYAVGGLILAILSVSIVDFIINTFVK